MPEDWNLDLLRSMGVRYLVCVGPLKGLEGKGIVPVYAPPAQQQPHGLVEGVRSFYTLPLWVYRLEGDLGRAHLTSQTQVFSTPEEVLAAMTAAPLATLRETAFMIRKDLPAGAEKESPPASVDGGKTSDASFEQQNHRVEVLRWTSSEWAFRVQAARAGLLVVPNNYHPKWKATLNGAVAPVLRANFAHMGVAIPGPGTYELVLRYEDPLLFTLHWLTVVGALLLLCAPPLAALIARKHNAAALVRREAEHGLQLPRLPLRALRGGLVLIAVWTLAFFLFEIRKGQMFSQQKPCFYLLTVTPFIGLAFLAWLWRFGGAMGLGGGESATGQERAEPGKD